MIKHKLRWLAVIVGLLICSSVAVVDAQPPSNLPRITVQNASRLEQVGVFGRGAVHDVAWSPDGDTLALASSVGIWLHDVNAFDVLPRLLELYYTSISSVDFSSDGALLAGGTYTPHFGFDPAPPDHNVQVWDMQTGSLLHQLSGDEGSIFSVAFGPDDTLLATGNMHGAIRLWNLATGASTIFDTLDDDCFVEDVSFSPDGTLIVSGCYGTAVHLWDVATGTRLNTLEGYGPVVFSPDGRLLAYPSSVEETDEDRAPFWTTIIRLWDVSAGVEIAALTVGDISVTDLAFSPDGRTLATASRMTTFWDTRDMGMKLWDIASGAEIMTLTLHEGEQMVGLAYSPDGTMLAGPGDSQGNVYIWDVATGTELVAWPSIGSPRNIAFSPNGAMLADINHRRIRLWETQTGAERTIDEQQLGNGWRSNNFAFSPDSTLLVFSESDRDGYTVHLWNLETGQAQATLDGHHRVREFAFSLDGTILAITDNENYDSGYPSANRIRLWNVQTATLLGTMESENWTIRSIAFNPEGELWIAGFDTTTELARLELWDIETNTRQVVWDDLYFGDEALAVRALAFNQDRTLLASGNWDGTVRIWNLATGTLQTMFTASPDTGLINDLAFSPDSELLSAATSETVWVWTVSGAVLNILYGHTEAIHTVAFSPDGTLLASGSGGNDIGAFEAISEDSVIRLWGVRE